eukprot:2544782-Amphidinium_carterae.1
MHQQNSEGAREATSLASQAAQEQRCVALVSGLATVSDFANLLPRGPWREANEVTSSDMM